jgi:hypothetical protein
MYKVLFIFLLLLGTAINAVAQQPGYEYTDSSLLEGETNMNDKPLNQEAHFPASEEAEASEAVDTDPYDTYIQSDTTLYIRSVHIPADTIRAWKKELAYINELDSLLHKANEEKKSDETSAPIIDGSGSDSFLQSLLSSPGASVIFWGLAIAFVLFILYKIFLSNGVFSRNVSVKTVNEISEEDKLPDDSDYQSMISKAAGKGDYRLAVRYHFLNSLQRLSEKGLLTLAAEKTNYQYVNEIDAEKRKPFTALVLNYDYVWYGHIDINQEQYGQIANLFNGFNAKI